MMPTLGAEFGKRSTLDVPEVGNGDNHVFVCIEVLRIELVSAEGNLCAALVCILVLELESLVLDDVHLH